MPVQFPKREITLEEIMMEIQTLRDSLVPVEALAPYEFPEGTPRAAVAPKKYTSTLPQAILDGLHLFAAARGRDFNAILSEAVRAYVPRKYFEAALTDILEELRQLFTQTASDEERNG